MSLLDQIRKDQLQARKTQNKIAAELLTTLIGEAAMVGKNAGNRESTDTEVKAVIKKFLKNNTETTTSLHLNLATPLMMEVLQKEKEILESYLPKQMTEKELKAFFENEIVVSGGKEVGILMKALKNQRAGQYDGKMAAEVVKELVKLEGFYCA